jgi:hypothetical protein
MAGNKWLSALENRDRARSVLKGKEGRRGVPGMDGALGAGMLVENGAGGAGALVLGGVGGLEARLAVMEEPDSKSCSI